MATERHAPDSATLTNLSGALADIDEDPDDAVDATWAVASGNNVTTTAAVTFPTPSGNLNTGAGLQEFKAKVRKFSATQTGTPTARIDLYEGGVLKQTGTEVNVTSAVSQVISQTWNANLLASLAGASVEARVVGTQTGGGPSVRNTVDIAAVEWNADYTATTPQTVVAPLLSVTTTLHQPSTTTQTAVVAPIVSGAVTVHEPPKVMDGMAQTVITPHIYV